MRKSQTGLAYNKSNDTHLTLTLLLSLPSYLPFLGSLHLPTCTLRGDDDLDFQEGLSIMSFP